MSTLWSAWRMRLKRRRILFRIWRKRHQIAPVAVRMNTVRRNAILAFTTLRNEAERLPFFLDYYRRLGVDHFLMVDNASTDGSREYLAGQPDVSLWTTPHSYKLSRFGVDWLGWLQIVHGHRHWCLTIDTDEFLVYPHMEHQRLRDLTAWLDRAGLPSFGTLMLDMYPKGPLDGWEYRPGDDPFETLRWFDAGNYRRTWQPQFQNYWIQGGVRARVFFADEPRRAPTMNKTPLVKWNRRYTYINSTHTLLPPRLNRVWDEGRPTGALLHAKFLPSIPARSREEKRRREHFANSDLYDNYYDALIQAPVLWDENATMYTDWKQLEDIGLITRGNWQP